MTTVARPVTRPDGEARDDLAEGRRGRRHTPADGHDVLRRIVGRFAPITLEELGAAALMDRLDTKYLLPTALVADALRAVLPDYRALEVAGTRLCRYETLYYDTADLALYHAHHAGRGRRCKVRRRTYVDTGVHFLEVKLRTGGGRTRKARVSLAETDADALARLGEEPLRELLDGLSAASLRPVIRVDYTRLTLVRRDGGERVTLDSRLTVRGVGGAASFPGAVVAEVKQPRRGDSPFADAVRALGVRAGGISKYCLGVATLEPSAKTNLFRAQLLQLHHTAGIPTHRHDAAASAR